VIEEVSVDTVEFTESFRSIYHEIGRRETGQASLKGSFSTWQGYQEAKEEKHQTEIVPFEKRPCPCGKKYPSHRPAVCFYFNKTLRPSYYSPKRDEEAVEKALAGDPAWRKWIEEAAKKSTKTSSHISQNQIANLSFASQLISPADTSLKNRWILDTGSGVHVCNEKRHFVDLELC
jgi:hypothetical protein